MEIAVRARDLEWNEELQRMVERRIDYAVDRHKNRIGRISASFSDLNGPRGGVDKLCQMTADVRGIGTVLITEKGSNLFEAISNAAGRLGLRIGQSIGRRKWPIKRKRGRTIRA